MPYGCWRTRTALIAALSTVLSTYRSLSADDWSQWRGPRRDGVADGVHLPRDWLDRKPTLRWRVPLGEGYAAPVVAGDRVFTFGREQGSEVVQAQDLATGRVRWRYAYPVPYEVREMARAHGAGPKATPVAHDRRLYNP